MSEQSRRLDRWAKKMADIALALLQALPPKERRRRITAFAQAAAALDEKRGAPKKAK